LWREEFPVGTVKRLLDVVMVDVSLEDVSIGEVGEKRLPKPFIPDVACDGEIGEKRPPDASTLGDTGDTTSGAKELGVRLAMGLLCSFGLRIASSAGSESGLACCFGITGDPSSSA
jgi:hypothetical protein